MHPLDGTPFGDARKTFKRNPSRETALNILKVFGETFEKDTVHDELMYMLWETNSGDPDEVPALHRGGLFDMTESLKTLVEAVYFLNKLKIHKTGK